MSFVNPPAQVRQFSFALILSGAASVFLVVAVGLLIALMQYQTRLVRLQPNVALGQLVYFVEIENGLLANLKELNDLSRKLSEAASVYGLASNEIEFRIQRICLLFEDRADAASAAKVARCSDFLRKIPFDGTSKQAIPQVSGPTAPVPSPDTTKNAGAASEATHPLPPAVLKGIQARFVEIMDDPKIGSTSFSKIIDLYLADLETIASKNQDYFLTTKPHYDSLQQRYQAACEYQNILIDIVRWYHVVEPGDCRRTIVKNVTPAVILPGEGKVGAPPSGSQRSQPVTPYPPSTPPPAPSPSTSATGVLPPSSNPTTAPQIPAVAPGGKGGPVESAGTAVSADRQRIFELVTSYMFYDKLSANILRNILLSPADFLALLLVGFCGIMGAMLRIVFSTYESGKDPSIRTFFVSPILGLICALVVYILFRAGFIAITDQTGNSETSSLSPFVIAIISMAAGLLSERSIALFRKTSGSWLGSVEASQNARWAVHLKKEIEKNADPLAIPKLAERLRVSEAKLNDWLDEKEMVPIEKQREIALILDIESRQLFTDLGPIPSVGTS